MKLLDELIENPFDPDRFKKSADLFSTGRAEADALTDVRPLKESLLSRYSGYISDFHSIKRFTCSEGASVAVLAVSSTGQDAFDEQSGYIQRKLIYEILAFMRCDAAVAAFYRDGTPEWKLSFVRLAHKGEVPHDMRANSGFRLSRVSFILGGGGRRCTSVITRLVMDAEKQQLLKLIQKSEQPSLKYLEKAFSYKIFARNLIRSFNALYPDICDLSALIKLPGFKMHESDPYDRILAMDPEMLGKLFESSYDRKDRKNRGTFYTPSEIVSFMCRESLAQYISNAAELPYGDCLALLDNEGSGCDSGSRMSGELLSDLPGTISRSFCKIDRALRQVRVFDPAAGSGAFVLGMLKEIVKARITVAACISAGKSERGEGRSLASGGEGRRPASYTEEGPASGGEGRGSTSGSEGIRPVSGGEGRRPASVTVGGQASYTEEGPASVAEGGLASYTEEGPGERTCSRPYMLALHAVRSCIFAADIDEEAVRMTRIRLWCALASSYNSGLWGFSEFSELSESPELPEFPELQSAQGAFCNVICGNSLDISAELYKNQPPFANVITEKGGFDIIIGNPPYISAVEGAKYGNLLRQSLKPRYPLLRGSFDVYTAFLLEGVGQINEKGVYCWIVPNSLLSSRYAAPVLGYLKENGLKRSISVSDVNVFHNVGVYPVIVIGNKKVTDRGYEEYIAASAEDPGNAVIREAYYSERYVTHNGIGTFKDFGIRFASGAAGFQAKALAACITEECVEGAIPFVVSGSIDKYSVRYSNVRYMGETRKKAFITKCRDIAQSKWDLWCGEKIVIAGLTMELEADYCGEPLALGVGAYALYDFGGFDPLFLLGLLNSRFMSEYIKEQFHEKHLAGGYLAINKSMLEQLPLVPADPDLQKMVAEKAAAVKSLMRQYRGDRSNSGQTSNKKQPDLELLQTKLKCEGLLKDIDGLIDRIYGG